jgi:hypothetical protein
MNKLISLIDSQPLVEQYFIGVYDIDDITSAMNYFDLNRKNLFFILTRSERLIFCGLSMPQPVTVWDSLASSLTLTLSDDFIQMMTAYGDIKTAPFPVQGRSDKKYSLYFALYFGMCYARSEESQAVFGRLSKTDMNYNYAYVRDFVNKNYK